MWVCAALAVVAVVVTQIVLRFQSPGTPLPNEKNKQQEPVESVLQKDEAHERQAEASQQMYPVGALVSTKAHGTAKVLAYDADTDAYDVEISDKEGEAAKTLKLREKEIEVTEVAAFYMYPIKSCAGIRLDSVDITGTHWHIYNDLPYAALSHHARMCCIYVL